MIPIILLSNASDLHSNPKYYLSEFSLKKICSNSILIDSGYLVPATAYFGYYNIVMSHIRNIREKIEDNPSKPIYIQTVWGVGYKFNNKLK